jgi:8-oxo-dGTP pyrophosphatase MutT (NUDIX family)
LEWEDLVKLVDLFENDEEHGKALEKTGFWGKRGAGCLFYAKSTGRYLIAHRSKDVEQPGTWGTWGGAIDSGESPEAAVEREAREEAGYHGDVELKHLWTFKHPSGFRYFNYLATVDDEFKPVLNWETQGYRWVKRGEWPKPLHPGMIALLENANL